MKKTAAEIAKAARDRMTPREKANIVARAAREKADRKAKGLLERTARNKITIQIPTGGLLANYSTRADFRKAAAKAIGILDWNEAAKENTAVGRRDMAIQKAFKYGLRGARFAADDEDILESRESKVRAKPALQRGAIGKNGP